jgi:uncharacterized protein CbrC (UPF0167 family)
VGRVSAVDLPNFPYYPGAVRDGRIMPSDERCSACVRKRGFIFTGVAYGERVPDDAVFCPWCISEGRAHAIFDARFNLVDAAASEEAHDEVACRTPGLLTWQDWDWPAHCKDAAVYVGQPTGAELRANAAALEALLRDVRQWDWGRDEAHVDEFIEGLGGSQVAYLFECRHCGIPLVRWDQD